MEAQSAACCGAVMRACTPLQPCYRDVDGDWFKGMWLSNGDFLRYFEAALHRPPPSAGGIVVVNAIVITIKHQNCTYLEASTQTCGTAKIIATTIFFV